jgi:tetratricopeptide (TPR) repeat protein
MGRRALSREHQTNLLAVLQLGFVCQQQGVYDRADELYTEAIEGFKRRYGKSSLGAVLSIFWRAWLFTDLGRTADAESLLNNLNRELHPALADDSEMVCTIRALIAETYQAQGRLAEAESMFAQAVSSWRRARGDHHANKLFALIPLVELCIDQGQFGRAETLLVEAQKAGAVLGGEGMLLDECPTTALARLRLAQRKPAEAESPARRALGIRMERHPDHWTRFDGMSLLGSALAGQKKFAEAEPLLVEGYEGIKERQERIPFLWRTRRPAQALARVVELYKAWGKPAEAEKWSGELYLQDLPLHVFARP